MNHQRFVLDNGLRVIVTPMPGMYSVTTAFFKGVGSRYETDQEAGSSHLIEHMLFKGTTRRPSPQIISEEIERVGGLINASTDKETTIYWTKVASDQLALSLDLLSDMLLHSLILPDDIEKEKRVILEELGMTFDSPQDWVHSIIDELIWPDQPAGREIAGTRESVTGLTHPQILSYMRDHYSPTTTVLSIAGAVNPADALALVHRHLDSWTPRHVEAPQSAELHPDPPVTRIDRRDTEQANLCLATRGVSRTHPDRHAFDLLNNILGGGMSSRLFVQLREERGMVYDIHTYTNKLSDTGAMVTYAGVDPEQSTEAVAAVVAEMRHLRDIRVTDDELNKVKDNYKGRLLLGLEDTQSVAGWCGAQELLLGQISSPEKMIAQVNAVTAEDIQRLAGEIFTDEYLRLAVIGPFDDPDEFDEVLHID